MAEVSAAIDVDALVAGVRAGQRASLGRAITLVESRNPAHRAAADELLVALSGGPAETGTDGVGSSVRLGITGVPGVGKSTFVEAFGTRLTAEGHRVAVLAVDPTSGRTGGSILGDKTRMARLATDPAAFVRPSPTSGTLGGVARATRESMVVVEAAGYDVVIVETVGVGQSETVVADMVDFFCVLMLPNAGDELQGIKKGILEVADLVVVNKADLDERRARQARRDYANALHLLTPASTTWTPTVEVASALTGDGLDVVWERVLSHRRLLGGSGELAERRRAQRLGWLWSTVEDRLLDALRSAPSVRIEIERVEALVRDAELTPSVAADRLLDAFWQTAPGPPQN